MAVAGGVLVLDGGALVVNGFRVAITEPIDASRLNSQFYNTGKPTDGGAPKEGPYSHLSDGTKVEPGRAFQPRQKQKILEANRQRNGGKLMFDDPNDPWFGKELQAPGPRRFAGDTVPPNEAQIDHIVPRIGPDGKPLGTNAYSNGRVISAEYNNFLRNKKPEAPGCP